MFEIPRVDCISKYTILIIISLKYTCCKISTVILGAFNSVSAKDRLSAPDKKG